MMLPSRQADRLSRTRHVLQEIDDQLHAMSRQMVRIAAVSGSVPSEGVLVDADSGTGITRIGDTYIVTVDDAATSRLAREMRLLVEERRASGF